MVCKLNTLEITLYAGLVICTLASGDKALKKPCIQILKNNNFMKHNIKQNGQDKKIPNLLSMVKQKCFLKIYVCSRYISK